MIKINVTGYDHVLFEFYVEHLGDDPTIEGFKVAWDKALEIVKKECPGASPGIHDITTLKEVMKLLGDNGYVFIPHEENIIEVDVSIFK